MRLIVPLALAISTVVGCAAYGKSDDVYTHAVIEPKGAPLVAAVKDGESKVYSFDEWNIENRIIFSNERVTLIHNTGPHTMSVRLSFHQYNKTENDKGTHEATLSVQLLGASGNILAVVFSGNNIVRDTCRDQGDHLFGPTDIPDDIYDLVTSANLAYSAHWDYEGAC